MTTKKKRKGPSDSATKFSVGTKKKGNDGNMWIIVENKNGIKHWSKISNLKGTKKHKSKRLLELEKDPESVWGKNKALEKFWQKLASGKEIVLIYKDNTSKIIKLANTRTRSTKQFNDFDDNPGIKAVLTSNMSSDSYEYLYPKAKNKTVAEVIKNYKKYFKSEKPIFKNVANNSMPLMKKVYYPY